MKRVLFAALVLSPAAAAAHLAGVPTTAWLTAPDGVGVVADQSFTFGWTDYDDTATTENTLIDFFYTDSMPPTYRIGGQPRGLDGVAIVKSVRESDLANQHTWPTAEIPPGSYFLFSIAHDPPFEMIAFSRGVVTVAHPGDPVQPAVIVTDPDGEADVAAGSYEIRWEAFDPDGSGTVRLEATDAPDGSGTIVIADGLDPALGRYTWDTSKVRRGEWMVRATIEDARGLSHRAWGRYFVTVVEGGGGGGGSAGAGGEGGAGGAGGFAGTDGSGGEAGAAPGGSGGTPPRDTGKGGGKGGGCAAGGGGLGLAGLAALAGVRRRPR